MNSGTPPAGAPERTVDRTRLAKDEVLSRLASAGNVAQFVSFGPDLAQRFSLVRGHDPNHRFGGLDDAIAALLAASPERSVNIRSYTPESPKSREFVYGVRSGAEAAGHIRRLAGEGLFTIANETIDVRDGGVSGVAFGDLVEFSPGDTPRCVEKPGTAAFPRAMGLRVLDTVYGFRPTLDYEANVRVEFSLHPLRRGYRQDHTIVWEAEEFGSAPTSPSVRWPNNFSRFLGDKAFGLLVAATLGLPVPATTLLSRTVPPFQFGRRTGTNEVWVRTCPRVQAPGRFSTRRGWIDPFQLVAAEDPEGNHLASVLSQEGVEAEYSGALLTTADGRVLVEGVRGQGTEFMLGNAGPAQLPDAVLQSVQRLYDHASALLGPVRFEWVYDGRETWLVQLHCGVSTTVGDEIYPGRPPGYIHFPVSQGLEALRALIEVARPRGEGIILVGDIGLSSHMGDVLRKAEIPSRIERLPPSPSSP